MSEVGIIVETNTEVVVNERVNKTQLLNDQIVEILHKKGLNDQQIEAVRLLIEKNPNSLKNVIHLANEIANIEVDGKISQLKTFLEEQVQEILDSKGLDESQIAVVKLLIHKNQDLIKNLLHLVDEITKDNVINVQDIPYLILFVKELYAFLYSIKKDIQLNSKKIQEMIPFLVKFLVKYLVKEKLDLPPADVFIIEQIIDSAVNVLQATTNLKIKSCKWF